MRLRRVVHGLIPRRQVAGQAVAIPLTDAFRHHEAPARPSGGLRPSIIEPLIFAMNVLSKTHFELFGLVQAFALDRTALDAAYRKVQAAVHPDRFSAGTDTDRRIAMQLATQANEAYSTLREPLSRAAYLCMLHGADPQVHSNTSMPGAFLGMQMDWRERLDEIRATRSLVQLESLRAEVNEHQAGLLSKLAEAIDKIADFPGAAGLVRQLMFIERFSEDLAMLEDQLAFE